MDAWETFEKTLDEPENGKAIQVAIPQENGSLKVDLEAFESILLRDDIKDLPVSLISIAGDFRTGKSFLLNAFLGWLNKNEKYGKVDDDWLVNATGSFTGGFHWKGGAELDTEGILMWSKPYIVEKDETKIAVLLIDTQGNFDQQSKRENNYKIFALSTLLSSVQNYNVSRQLQDNRFEHLQAFLTYAISCQTRVTCPFQTLNFIVRDWPMPYQYQYGKDGGNQYLDQSWSRALAELDKTSGASIRGSFQRVDCYLLPFPGSAVNTCPDSGSLRVEAVEKEFLREIQKLTKGILSSDDLIIKCIDGHIVTAGTLYDYVRKWNECLHADRLPDIHTMTELIIENHCGKQMDGTLKIFDGFLLSVNLGTFVEWEIFDDMVEKAIAECKKSFLESTLFGRGTQLHTRCVDRLSKSLNEQKTQAEKKNEENQYRELETICKKLIEEHKTALDKIGSFLTYGRDLDKAHDSILAELRKLQEAPVDSRRLRGVSLLFEACEGKMENYLQRLKHSRNQSIKDAAMTGAAITGSACVVTGIIILAGPQILAVGTALVVIGQLTNTAMMVTTLTRVFRWWRGNPN